jgi:hypothetical protein
MLPRYLQTLEDFFSYLDREGWHPALQPTWSLIPSYTCNSKTLTEASATTTPVGIFLWKGLFTIKYNNAVGALQTS